MNNYILYLDSSDTNW